MKTDVNRLLRSIKRTSIAVESSGGLDCSIVIGMLRHSHLDPLLIAVDYERYEYRTERLIQLEVARGTRKTFLKIDGSRCLPFSLLTETPRHIIPSDHSVFYAFSKVIAALCRTEGIQVLISGDGFDELLGLELEQETKEIPIDFYPWMQVPPWANEHVFHPSGISYAPGASSWRLIESLFLLRAGQQSDNRKMWARRTFADLIPDRLCKYQYKASAQGIWTEGAQKAANDILLVCKRAYSVCPEPEIAPARVEKLIPSSTSNRLETLAALITRVSFAGWITSIIGISDLAPPQERPDAAAEEGGPVTNTRGSIIATKQGGCRSGYNVGLACARRAGDVVRFDS